MKILYSPSTGATYYKEIHGEDMPIDVVPISESTYNDIIKNPAPGMVRDHKKNGQPFLTEEVLTDQQKIDIAISQRRSAYQAESDPLKNEADYDSLIKNFPPDYSKWAEKVSEIKSRYPFPDVR